MKKHYAYYRAKHNKHFNVCFYCGCEATEWDYIPSFALVKEAQALGKSISPKALPSCYECHALLSKCQKDDFSLRMKALNQALERKYKKPLRVFRLWDESELNDMSDEFAFSIRAGMKLGKETQQRLDFTGFELESENAATPFVPKVMAYHIGELQFKTFDDAFDYAITHYGFAEKPFYDECVLFGGDLTLAIASMQNAKRDKQHKDDVGTVVKRFATTHKQNSDFVLRSVRQLMEGPKKYSLEDALDYLYQHYIAK